MASVLIVDDDPGVRHVVRRMLEANGHQLREAATGAEALAAVSAAPPDVMVLDLMMPGMNGMQLLAALGKRQDLPPIPTIVITGSITSESHVQSLGARGLLRKPFTRVQLAAAVETVLRRPVSRAVPHDDPSRACVLIVEDDPDARMMLETLLRLEGYETITARNGSEGLAIMRERRPCAVLLDLMMPVMDGWQFRRQQLTEPELASVPVVCVTAVGNPDEVRTRLGVPCFTKPVDVDQLLTEVQRGCLEH